MKNIIRYNLSCLFLVLGTFMTIPAASSEDSNSEVFEPEDIDNLGLDLAAGEELFASKITSEGMKNHGIASAAVMQGIAKHFKLNYTI